MTQRAITTELCACGRCKDHWLVGIGKFVQGSGFTAEEAQRITNALNTEEQLRAALVLAKEQFAFYAEQHDAKGTPESAAKAEVNRKMVAMCAAALGVKQ